MAFGREANARPCAGPVSQCGGAAGGSSSMRGRGSSALLPAHMRHTGCRPSKVLSSGEKQGAVLVCPHRPHCFMTSPAGLSTCTHIHALSLSVNTIVSPMLSGRCRFETHNVVDNVASTKRLSANPLGCQAHGSHTDITADLRRPHPRDPQAWRSGSASCMQKLLQHPAASESSGRPRGRLARHMHARPAAQKGCSMNCGPQHTVRAS
jgi:hypothetical protein